MSTNSPNEAKMETIEILHVDDDSSILDLTASFFETELDDTNITKATSPDEALSRLSERGFDCIVSDYDMPERNGLEFLADVLAERPELPFILYTGKGNEEIAAEAINAGVTGYLQKGGPDQIRRLANRVKHAANEYQTQRESERYSAVLQALNYPIYVVDDNATFEYINDAFVELTGYDRNEILGSSPGLIKTDEAVEKADRMLAGIVSSSGPDREKFRVDIQTADGDIVPCYDHMAALPFDDEFRGSVGILRDATTEHKQRKELLQQNERLEQFTSVVSHDIRTPLGNAKTAAMLARTTSDEEHFDQLEEAHERMDTLIEDVLTLAREGETIGEMEPVSISEIASDASRTLCGKDDILELPEGDVTVIGDRSRLSQLVENLIRNSAEHSPSPVTITVGQYSDGFYIADNGPGIDEDNRESVFDPGYTTTDEGTGFGLAIVKRIAEAHGWEVTVTGSDSNGARFEFATEERGKNLG